MFCVHGQSAIHTVDAQSFYRSPESLFPSGQANPLDLRKRKVRDFQELNFTVVKEGKTMRLTTDLILRDVDLSARVAHARTSEIGHVHEIKGAWALVSTAKNSDKTWWALTDVLPVPDDRGLAIPLTYLQMRRGPDWKAEYLQEIFPRTRLKVHQFKDNWVEVSLLSAPGQQGWVDIGALVLKHDFANFALPKKGKWTPVRYRQGTDLITGSNDKLSIHDLDALMTRPDLGLAAEAIGKLKLRSYVNISSWEYVNWAVSKLPAHGEVFWKASTNESLATNADEVLTYEDILKRPIFSVAFCPRDPKFGIISAAGIFVTEDGLQWRRLKQFREENFPVAISEKNELFVGQHRSTDAGQTFNPFLKWEQITAMLENGQRYSSRIVRLVEIQPLPKNRVQIEIDNGIKVARFQGSTKFGLVLKWEPIKAK